MQISVYPLIPQNRPKFSVLFDYIPLSKSYEGFRLDAVYLAKPKTGSPVAADTSGHDKMESKQRAMVVLLVPFGFSSFLQINSFESFRMVAV